MGSRRYLLILFVLVFAASLVAGCGGSKTEPRKEPGGDKKAAKWPEKPIEWVLAQSPGGGTDIFARQIAKPLSRELGQEVRVVNYSQGPAAAGLYISKQPVDGYTWSDTAGVAVGHARGIPGIGFDNWEPIANCQNDPRWLVVLKNSKFKDAREMLEHAKKSPVTVGGVAPDGPDALAVYLLSKKSGAKFKYVPFDGTGEVITAAMGGNLDVMAGSLVSFAALMKSGDARPILLFGDQKADKFPDVPTAKDLGYDVVMATYRGMGVLKNTPQEVKDRIKEAVAKAVQDPEYQQYVKSSYLDIIPGVTYGADAMKQLKQLSDATAEFLADMKKLQEKKN